MINDNLNELAFPMKEIGEYDNVGFTKHEYATIHLAAAMLSANSKVDFFNDIAQESISNAAYEMAETLLNKFK